MGVPDFAGKHLDTVLRDDGCKKESTLRERAFASMGKREKKSGPKGKESSLLMYPFESNVSNHFVNKTLCLFANATQGCKDDDDGDGGGGESKMPSRENAKPRGPYYFYEK
ncbi:hypothetical protein FRC03_008864 [Tulasnella sp. 419]|nr:hypothetical protein FRC03_008864 [Tulasnella sp. 419]